MKDQFMVPERYILINLFKISFLAKVLIIKPKIVNYTKEIELKISKMNLE